MPSSHSFQNISPQDDWRTGDWGGSERVGKGQRDTVALPLVSLQHPEHWGLICLAYCLCTLLLLVTFWCHGVKMKWLPSHVAACGSTTAGTMRSRGVGAGTQEAPAGRNALTLPPPRLPWNRELVEALLTTSQRLCVPGSSQGPARTQGEERHRRRHIHQRMGALKVALGDRYVPRWPPTSAEIRLMSRLWFRERASTVSLKEDTNVSAETRVKKKKSFQHL